MNQVATITEFEGPSTINREWGRRRITVQCNVRGRDVKSLVASGIPLGLVGGVLALWLRGLPFTVSSAVGFLPMAVNVGVGGEVQRPLATGVIGGLLTNTVLTLLVLPVLYLMRPRARCSRSAEPPR